jgi:hypothetical protein
VEGNETHNVAEALSRLSAAATARSRSLTLASVRLKDVSSHASNIRQASFYSAPELAQHRLHKTSDVFPFGVCWMWSSWRAAHLRTPLFNCCMFSWPYAVYKLPTLSSLFNTMHQLALHMPQ